MNPDIVRVLVSVCASLSFANAVKFPRENGITITGDSFRVGEFTSASCNFIKFKQENINKIEWSISYEGVSTNAFTSYYENANKEVIESQYFTVDEHSSGEKVVRIRLNDDREDEITICCKVESIRDSGYGMIKAHHKEKCTAVPVESENIPQAKVALTVTQELVRLGEQLRYTCDVDQIRDSNLNFVILVNSNQMDSKSIYRQSDKQLTNSLTISEDIFYQGQGEKFDIVCILKKGDFEISRDTVTIKRDRSSHQVFPTHTSPANIQTPRKGRFYADPQSHRDHGNVPCHSYVIIEEGSTQGTLIRGELPIDIQGSIKAYASFESRYETPEDVVNVLNILGYNGYRVVGMGNNLLNRLTWTLERPYFEFHPNSYKN